MEEDKQLTQFTAEQVADYVVCPEAWRLKHVSRNRSSSKTERPARGRAIRKAWVKQQELSNTLREYAKIAYLLTVLVVIIVFLTDLKRTSVQKSELINTPTQSSAFSQKFDELAHRHRKSIPNEITYLLLIVGLLIFLWDLFDRRSSSIRKNSGLEADAEIVSAKESENLPSELLIAADLGLSSRPDALIREEGMLIPVDIRPTAKKIRDRHVVAMLVHLRVLEANEGTRAPYGVLLMGAKKRQVRIKNTDEKQHWLDSLLSEMRSIQDGVPAVASPAEQKCRNCDVESICAFSALREETVA